MMRDQLKIRSGIAWISRGVENTDCSGYDSPYNSSEDQQNTANTVHASPILIDLINSYLVFAQLCAHYDILHLSRNVIFGLPITTYIICGRKYATILST